MRTRTGPLGWVHRLDILNELFHYPVSREIENLGVIFNLKGRQNVLPTLKRIGLLEFRTHLVQPVHIRFGYPRDIPGQNGIAAETARVDGERALLRQEAPLDITDGDAAPAAHTGSQRSP